MQPAQNPLARAHVVIRLEQSEILLQLDRQRELVLLVRRPVPRREDADVEIEAADARGVRGRDFRGARGSGGGVGGVSARVYGDFGDICGGVSEGGNVEEDLFFDPGGEAALDVLAEVHVGDHAFELAGEVRAAAEFEFCDEEALCVVAVGLFEKEALGEEFSGELLENVLVVEVGEDADDLLELCFDVFLGHFRADARGVEQGVAVVCKEFGGGAVLDLHVDKDLEGVLHGLVEDGRVAKARDDEVEVLIVESQELFDVVRGGCWAEVVGGCGCGGGARGGCSCGGGRDFGLLCVLLCVDECDTFLLDVGLEVGCDGWQAVGDVDPGEEPVESREVVAGVVLEE
mmetsp:Transcript_10417/g.27326  ORF Transcript_10417/g.27326 Transcript_10417/m.27326 type:complete len:345 (-) Transcript_10417:742-1776(-)